jgi:hypothetical protein
MKRKQSVGRSQVERYACGVGLTLGLVLLLWFGLSYGVGATGTIAVYWFLAGNVLYYLVGIVLAFQLKDNRAFCKYVCPVTVPLMAVPIVYGVRALLGKHGADRADRHALHVQTLQGGALLSWTGTL